MFVCAGLLLLASLFLDFSHYLFFEIKIVYCAESIYHQYSQP